MSCDCGAKKAFGAQDGDSSHSEWCSTRKKANTTAQVAKVLNQYGAVGGMLPPPNPRTFNNAPVVPPVIPRGYTHQPPALPAQHLPCFRCGFASYFEVRHPKLTATYAPLVMTCKECAWMFAVPNFANTQQIPLVEFWSTFHNPVDCGSNGCAQPATKLYFDPSLGNVYVSCDVHLVMAIQPNVLIQAKIH